MNAKVRQAAAKTQTKTSSTNLGSSAAQWQSPMIRPATTKIELAEKQQAIHCGGIALMNELIKTTGLRKFINEAASVFKLHLPYDEADHVFNIALNLLAGGTLLGAHRTSAK